MSVEDLVISRASARLNKSPAVLFVRIGSKNRG